MKRNHLFITVTLTAVLFCLWGCSPNKASAPSESSSVSAETKTSSDEETGQSKTVSGETVQSDTGQSETVQNETVQSETAESKTAGNKPEETASSLEESDYKGFAEEIQDIFTDRDMEVLAQFCAYPVYVTTEADTEGRDVPDSAGLEAQKDDIFTEAMIQAVTAVDTEQLKPSQAGIFMGSETGAPGLFFTLSEEGTLKIMAINSEILK